MELYYNEYGRGQPLIILHGLLGASGNWHTLSSRRFAPQFHVYALDLRNHGRSPHDEVFSYEAMAEDLREFMDQRGLETAHVLGHSMGGKTAMLFALTYPERVDRLIVADMAPRSYPPHHASILDALHAVDPASFGSREEVDQALARHIKALPVRQFLLKNLAYDSQQQRHFWQMNLEGISRNYDKLNAALEAEGTFSGPALFIRGEKSDYITDEDFAEITRLFPAATLATIPGAGHWVHADAPDAFADAVLAF